MKLKITLFLLLVSVFPAYGEEQFVYHASPTKGLKELTPRVSTHGKNWVYATKYIGIVAAYLGKWGDFDLDQGSCDGTKIHLVERYKDAFKKVYGSSKGGSIYKLNAAGFLENMTGMNMEVVNPSKVTVVEEIVIDSPLEYLKELSKKGELELFNYPNRPSCVPKDDSDLIEKTVYWIKEGKSGTKDSLLKRHPDLAERLNAALKHEQASITLTRGQKLLEWNKQKLTHSSDLKKTDLNEFFAPKFHVKANERSYDADYDTYFEFLEKFRASIKSIHYEVQEFIVSGSTVSIPLIATVTKLNGAKDILDAIMIIKTDNSGKIIHWQEVYSMRK